MYLHTSDFQKENCKETDKQTLTTIYPTPYLYNVPNMLVGYGCLLIFLRLSLHFWSFALHFFGGIQSFILQWLAVSTYNLLMMEPPHIFPDIKSSNKTCQDSSDSAALRPPTILCASLVSLYLDCKLPTWNIYISL